MCLRKTRNVGSENYSGTKIQWSAVTVPVRVRPGLQIIMKNSVFMDGDLLGMLQVVFLVLKLCNLIDWSWVWVLSPMWIPLSIYIVFYIIYKLIKK